MRRVRHRMCRGLQLRDPRITNIWIIDMGANKCREVLAGRQSIPHQGQGFALRKRGQLPFLSGDLGQRKGLRVIADMAAKAEIGPGGIDDITAIQREGHNCLGVPAP